MLIFPQTPWMDINRICSPAKIIRRLFALLGFVRSINSLSSAENTDRLELFGNKREDVMNTNRTSVWIGGRLKSITILNRDNSGNNWNGENHNKIDLVDATPACGAIR